MTGESVKAFVMPGFAANNFAIRFARTSMRTVLLGWTIACATTHPGSAQQPLKSLLDRAQQGLDSKAVEDLIGKLENSKPRGQAQPSPSSPGGPPGPASETPKGPILPKSPTTDVSKSAAPTLPPPIPLPDANAPAQAAISNVTVSPPSPPLTAPIPTNPVPTIAPPPSPIEATAVRTPQASPPSVDLEVAFEFNNARISPSALPTLMVLGKALSDPRLAAATFLIAGHTDAKGRADYNLRLSQQRAEAVKAYLIANHGVDAKRLTAKGYGETRLKNPHNPQGDENRRVQIVNTAGPSAR